MRGLVTVKITRQINGGSRFNAMDAPFTAKLWGGAQGWWRTVYGGTELPRRASVSMDCGR